VANGGTGVTTSTGSGNNVLSASPTFTGTVVAPTINAGAATALTLQSAGTTAITVDTSQNVGIGTSTTAEKLTVVGQISTTSDLVFKDSGLTARGYIFGTSSALFYRATSGLPHVFQNVGTELMRIDSAGSVGIGTSSPTSRLHGLANADESLSLVSVSSTRAAIGEIKAETRQCSFNVNNTSNFAISNIVTTTSGWRVVFRGSWSNNYEGGGLTSPAPELEATSAFPSFLVGSRTLTVSRNGTTGFLQVNAGDAYYISFAGSIEIFQTIS
jgi:hypothetical protein